MELLPDGSRSGWHLQPVGPGAVFDSVPGFFARRVAVAGPAGPTTAQVRYLPHARQSQVWAPTADGGSSAVTFRFPIYAFEAGDVDNDGHADVLIGPIKPTRYDSAWRRRLFVYFLDSAGRLQPRWRGSRLSYRLLCFRTVRARQGPTYVRTLEQAPDGRYCVGTYYWQGFGLALDNFRARRQSLDTAYQDFVL